MSSEVTPTIREHQSRTIDQTPKAAPSIPAPTAAPTTFRIQTSTPDEIQIPTLPPQKAVDRVNELIDHNAGCLFPCWWGLTPGETSWDEAEILLKPYAFELVEIKRLDENKRMEADFLLDDSPPTLSNLMIASFSIDPNTTIIETISSSQSFSITELFRTYGKPDEVWLKAAGIPKTGPVYFYINFIYTEERFQAGSDGYGDLVIIRGEDYTSVCPEKIKENARGLFFWSSNNNEDEIYDYLLERAGTGNHYVELHEVTTITVSELVEVILGDKNTPCLEIPMRIWYEQ